MEEYFESVLLEAILRCEGRIFTDSNKNKMGFWQIYPFTTENINGYIRYFDLNNKSLLTVGSSADQVINAILLNCRDITVIDINSFTKFYYYLKVACIIDLEFKEFCDFFCYRDYPKYCKNNKDVFFIDTYNKIKSSLRLLDYESYLFWDELFNTYNGEDIRKEIFSYDEDMLESLECMNLYMSNIENFNMVKEKLKKVRPKFIINNIFDATLDKKFDNIWLSNMACYHKVDKFKKMVDKIYKNLNDDGKLLMAYLYDFYKDSIYHEGWQEIYNLKKVFSSLSEYNYDFINFTGVKDTIFKRNNSNDAIILIKKNRS